MRGSWQIVININYTRTIHMVASTNDKSSHKISYVLTHIFFFFFLKINQHNAIKKTLIINKIKFHSYNVI